MKPSTILLLLTALFFQCSFAQRVTSGKVPKVVKEEFYKKFSAVKKVKWEKENGELYEAVFKQNKSEISVVFNAFGVWKETETEAKISDLNTALLESIKSSYPGYEIEEVYKIESAEHGNCFEIELEKGKEEVEILITAEGKVIQQLKERKD